MPNALCKLTFLTGVIQSNEARYRGTIEYGFFHRGVEAKGERWMRAQVLERVKAQVREMVNLKEMKEFIKGSNGGTIDVQIGEDNGKVLLQGNSGREEKRDIVKENYYLVVVSNARNEDGIETKTRKSWDGSRSWEASGVFKVDVEIYKV